MIGIEEEIGALLSKNNLTLAIIESATGGLISHRITNVPGSSVYYKGSITAYSNDIKTEIVGVDRQVIEKYGAVSPQTAEGMAEKGRHLLAVDICIADTGIAGPAGETENKPMGLFFIGLSSTTVKYNRKHIFQGSRADIKHSAAEAAFNMLKDYLLTVDSSESVK
jgi:nicotinamide-nucleotide amidase